MVDGENLIPDAAIVVDDTRIVWAGAAAALPLEYQSLARESLGGRLVTPALIDCHTHLIHAGDRAEEFARRQQGESYAAIANTGGGIMSTVRATRAASDNELLDSALGRLDDLMADGVGVVEVKSGYGLTINDEVRMLRIARQLEQHRPVRIVTTWLAAHAVPPEFSGQADRYIDEVVIPGLRVAHDEGLVDAVDGFCESIGFSREQVARIFDVAALLGLPVKLHAEQLSDQRGAQLVCDYRGLSADHLEFLAEADVESLAAANVVAVLLPGAFYNLGQDQRPPVDVLRQHQVPMAVATDCNPGSSPLTSLLAAMNLARTQFDLSHAESLAGATRNAAAALGLAGDYGVIVPGVKADLAIWNCDNTASLSYWIGHSPLLGRVTGGATSWLSP